MIPIYPIKTDRIRKIAGSFAFIEHRFLRKGIFQSLSHHELILYFFLVLVSDRNGLSYYSYDKICTLTKLSVDEYILARNNLIDKNLIAFDGHLFQALALPPGTCACEKPALENAGDMQKHDPATICTLIRQSLGGKDD
jgi:hypothetical protein